LRGEPLEPVFDTQMAASLLGLGEQIGYANLVRQILDIQLTKAHSRSDWCARPLQPAQLCYAADDVRYLNRLYPRLQTLLNDKGRLDWLLTDSQRLYDASNYQSDSQDAWRRIPGVQQLAPRQLSVIRALAAWREREAARRDLPRKWVLTDAALLDLARLMPGDRSALGRMRAVQKNQCERYGTAITTTIDAALKEPPSQWPAPPTRRILSPAQEAAVDMLMALVRSQAAIHEVSPATIATRSALERLVLGDTDVPALHGWRAEIAGRLIKTMLEGELRVGVRHGELQIEKRC
jgi:ribonuclease D